MAVFPWRDERNSFLMIPAPPGSRFPRYPISWYLFCTTRELRRGPRSRELLGHRLVAYRTTSGQVAVLDARCSHLGADLGQGRVVGEALQCPFHHWEYGPDGRCLHIPAGGDIPATARQISYPVVERHGFVFFFNAPQPLFPLPCFPDTPAEDLVAASPFSTILDCPWYLVGANHFDLQHFRAAHDRRLVGTPVVTCPTPFARAATGTFRIEGTTLRDRLTRWCAGPEVTLDLTDWCGNLMLTTATFARTRTYGMMINEPLADGRVLVRVIVFGRRSTNPLGRVLLDPLRLRLRRWFLRGFLRSDTALLNGLRYNPHGLIDADRELAAYLDWLAAAAHGKVGPSAASQFLDAGQPPCYNPPSKETAWTSPSSDPT